MMLAQTRPTICRRWKAYYYIGLKRYNSNTKNTSMNNNQYSKAFQHLHNQKWKLDESEIRINTNKGNMSIWIHNIENYANKGQALPIKSIIHLLSTKSLLLYDPKGTTLTCAWKRFYKACYIAKNFEFAKSTLLKMDKKYLNHKIGHIVVKTCSEAGDSQGVIDVINYLTTGSHSLSNGQQNGIWQTHGYWVPILNSYAAVGKVTEALATVSRNFTRPNVFIFNILLKACRVAKDFEQAKIIVSTMKKRRVVLDKYSFGLLILTGAEAGHLNECWELIVAKLSTYEVGEECDVDIYPLNHVMKEYAVLGDWEKVKKMFETINTLSQYGIHPDNFSYGICVHAACAANKIEELSFIIKEMISKEGLPSHMTWRFMSAAFSSRNNHKDLRTLIDIILSIGSTMEVNKSDWNILKSAMWRDLIGCLGRAGLPTDAYNALLDMKRLTGIEPSSTCWQRVVRAYSEDQDPTMLTSNPADNGGNWAKALNLLRDMRRTNVKPTPMIWKYVILAACRTSSDIRL